MDKGRRSINMGFTSEPFPEGTHMCLIYNNEDERRETVAKFLQSGLEMGEKVFYLVDRVSPEEMRAHISDYGIKVPANARPNQLQISATTDTYLAGGSFKMESWLKKLEALYPDTMKENFAGARASGEMEWALRGVPGTEDLVEYEARVNIVVSEFPTTAICQYDARKFSGAILFDILSVHPMMIVRDQVVRNPYYIPPEEFIKGMKKR